jgi:hypothetical protein
MLDNRNSKQEEKKIPKGRKMLYEIAIALVLWCVVFDVFKVTDPSDPKFDPYQFKFTDYSLQELDGVFIKLFHPGVDRTFVENVLVSRGGADIVKSGDVIAYAFKLPLLYISKGIPTFAYSEGGCALRFKYDSSDKAVALQSCIGAGFNPEIIAKPEKAYSDEMLKALVTKVRKEQENKNKNLKEREHDK